MSDLEKPTVKNRKRRARRKQNQLGFLPGMDRVQKRKSVGDKQKVYNARRKELMILAGRVKGYFWIGKENNDGVNMVKVSEKLDSRDDAADLLLKLGLEKYREMNNS